MVNPYDVIFSSVKRKRTIKPQKYRVESKYILLDERSQSERATHCMSPIMEYSVKGNTIEKIQNLWLPGVWVKGIVLSR